MTPKRKKMTDAEKAFLTGEISPPESTPAESKPMPRATRTTKASKPSDLMSLILEPVEPKEASIRFTADLPADLHKRLTLAAAQSGKRKVDIVRELLDAVLPQLE